MLVFYKEYSNITFLQPPVAKIENNPILQPSVAKLPEPFNSILQPSVAQLENANNQNDNLFLIGWSHHIILIQKIKDIPTRYWYMQQIIINGWSKEMLIVYLSIVFITSCILLIN